MTSDGFSEFIPVKQICGCYLLWKDGVVVYVGQSGNILKRIGEHMNKKDFDGYSYIESDGDLNELEADLIVKYNPALNSSMPPSKKYVSYLWYRGVIRDGATPVWGSYYLASDIVEHKQPQLNWRGDYGCVCANCRYGESKPWYPFTQDNYCPMCNSTKKVMWLDGVEVTA